MQVCCTQYHRNGAHTSVLASVLANQYEIPTVLQSRAFQHKARKVETDCLDCRDRSTTSRSTRGGEQTKAAKIETETSLQRAERLEVLSKTKEERLRRRQVKMSRVTRGVEQHKSMKD